MTAQDTTIENDEEDYFRRLRKRRRVENTTDDETTNTQSIDNPSMDASGVTRIGGHMMCNSKNVEFDGIVQMDIDTPTNTLMA